MGADSQFNTLEAQIRECYARAAWTHKTHEKCADLLNRRLNNYKWCQIGLSALVTTGVLITIFGRVNSIIIVSSVLSLLLTVLNTYLKQYDLGGEAQKHADAATAVWNIRESYLSLLTDMHSANIKIEQAREKRDFLQNELFSIYKSAPRTFKKAYKESTKALKALDELTFSDEEIDKLLPPPLKKCVRDK
ncbi:TPA: SLATT domain-containing protein [Legionella pneumophila]|nr:SLATT domain-containing protein [Legionella pneumophila]